MKVRINNKKIFILILIVLLLILAVGYAVFSETLTISGTANAKGTFDLEFQNAEVVKNIGANAEETTAEISADKNTLIVNVADLAYPGAGVEFSVDIVNVGTMPAVVQAVTPNNITGSDKIKVTGLDGIKAGHPKIEVGDRCNIHFTVEWPEDVTEIGEYESSISFGLQIEYTQSTGEVFDGQVSHTDTDKSGNTVTGGEIETPTYETLVSQIKAEDYGKTINYVATVKGQKVSNWKVLYNDKSNVYLILDDFLPNTLVPSETGLNISGTHGVYSNTDSFSLLKGLIAEEYWKEFSSGADGAAATGGASFDIIIKSYNEKYNANLNTDLKNTDTITLDNTDTLYVPHNTGYNEIYRYWLTDLHPRNALAVCNVDRNGLLNDPNYSKYNSTSAGIRPVVKLPGTVEGTVGETVEIK